MTKAKSTPATSLKMTKAPEETTGAALARRALAPAANAAIVMGAYASKTVGSEIELAALVEGLGKIVTTTQEGDLSTMEAMLVSQATALQTIFSVLSQRAAIQSQPNHCETFLRLALKAQSQSRATITALVDLKYPRQATFVSQANIAHGNQQVNNCGAPASDSRAEEIVSGQNKLLARPKDGSTYLDAGAAAATTRGNSKLEAMATVNGADKRRRQGGRGQ